MTETYLPHSDSYVRFVRETQAETGKTQIWSVLARVSYDTLGEIRWFGRWHQYAFKPRSGTVFSVGCINDIADFVHLLMNQWRAGRKR